MPKKNYFPFGTWNKGVGGSLPKISDGSDGDLVIFNGQTVQITAGSIKSYNTIDIQTGGTLEIIGAEAWTQIACRGSFNLDGTITGRTSENGTTYTLIADNWLGGLYSHTVLQASGGHGGFAKYDSAGSVSTPSQSNGNGGGGNGFSNRDTQNTGNPIWCGPVMLGGNGVSNGTSHNVYYENSCITSAFTANGGTGNLGGHGQAGNLSGGNGTQADAFAQAKGGNGGGGGGGAGAVREFKGTWSNQGSGAGGGGRGEHGRHVFILAEEGISGSGSVNMNGNNGYNGGPHPGGTNDQSGGGGGGAGGSAGKVTIKHVTGSTVTPSVTTTGGSGGSPSPINTGGGNGYWNTGNATYNPTGGSNGFNNLINEISTY